MTDRRRLVSFGAVMAFYVVAGVLYPLLRPVIDAAFS